MEKLRKVIIKKFDRIENGKSVYIPDGAGWFHCWGMAYDEFETGPGLFTTAIVERQTGEIESVPAECVRFIEPYEPGSNH